VLGQLYRTIRNVTKQFLIALHERFLPPPAFAPQTATPDFRCEDTLMSFCCGKSKLAGLSPFALRKLRGLAAAFAERKATKGFPQQKLMRRSQLPLLCMLAALGVSAGSLVAKEGSVPQSTTTGQANYGRVGEPKIKPAFLPLPPGSVEPSGWLRDWAVAARQGLTGHLDEYHPVFRDGWKGVQIDAPNAAADGTGWPLEQCAYWLDGAIRLGLVLHDDALIAKIRARLDPIVDGVNKASAGTSFIYWKKGYKPEGFNSWADSQLGRALVALYQGTGDKRVLDALVKVYADYASILCGPLLFALPIPDIDANTPVNDAKWQYALDIDPGRPNAGIKMERKPMPSHWDWPLDAPIAIKAPAQAFDWKPNDAQALPNEPVTGNRSDTIRLIPYGCTKFRISMFPVTPKTMHNALKTTEKTP
jgi:hypothetical protein